MDAFFPGFTARRFALGEATIHAEVGGAGPPVLLLHGYPQTHVAWHRIAPELARHFTVVAPDLRGYGDSTGPQGDPGHLHHCKRTLAADMLALMRELGWERFALVGHDRGGRVGYRLALDRPDAVACFTSLTVIPSPEMWQRIRLKGWHWLFFAQPYDLPERLLRADPAWFLDWTLERMVRDPGALTPQARAEYHRAFAREPVRHAMMEDYRAGAGIDLEHDRADRAAGRKLQCPVQVLWSDAAPAPLDTWRAWADHVEGAPVAAGHMLAEEAPEAVLAQLLPFLRAHAL